MGRNRTIHIREERGFGEILGDGMKIVFRHIPVISSLVLTYAMPFIGAAFIYLILSGVTSEIMEVDLFSQAEVPLALLKIYLVLGLGIGLAIIALNLIIYATIIVYDRDEGVVTSQRVGEVFKEEARNYLGSIGMEALLFITIIVFVAMTAIISPVIFGLLYFISIFIIIWLYNVVQFLGIVRIEENLDVVAGIKRAFYLVKGHWWECFGLVIVSSLIGSILMYGVIFIFLFVMTMIDFVVIVEDGTSGSSVTIWLSAVFGIIYVIVMAASNMYLAGVRALKYYDLVERKEARNLMISIEGIGRNRSSGFENEGEF